MVYMGKIHAMAMTQAWPCKLGCHIDHKAGRIVAGGIHRVRECLLPARECLSSVSRCKCSVHIEHAQYGV